jgi:hypothetical protein
VLGTWYVHSSPVLHVRNVPGLHLFAAQFGLSNTILLYWGTGAMGRAPLGQEESAHSTGAQSVHLSTVCALCVYGVFSHSLFIVKYCPEFSGTCGLFGSYAFVSLCDKYDSFILHTLARLHTEKPLSTSGFPMPWSQKRPDVILSFGPAPAFCHLSQFSGLGVG